MRRVPCAYSTMSRSVSAVQATSSATWASAPAPRPTSSKKYFVFRPGDHATTFSDNFLPRAAALAVLGEDESLEFSSTEDAQGGGGGYRMGT
mmetsp:Transcript_19167/g.50875  ORF Transcript_19167/g.50875 Transcript_19167/m.50875 type:complete len:92 (-) Transcript_19167:357-632(-)